MNRHAVEKKGGAGRIYFHDEVPGEVLWEFPLQVSAERDLVRGLL